MEVRLKALPAALAAGYGLRRQLLIRRPGGQPQADAPSLHMHQTMQEKGMS